jgi:hypothetical protein
MEDLDPIDIQRFMSEFHDSEDEVRRLIADLKQKKNQVALILEKYPKTRNSDFLLTWTWLRLCPKVDVPKLPYKTVRDLCGALETVRRVRQKLNEECRYLPTDPVVLKKRRRKAEHMRKATKRF